MAVLGEFFDVTWIPGLQQPVPRPAAKWRCPQPAPWVAPISAVSELPGPLAHSPHAKRAPVSVLERCRCPVTESSNSEIQARQHGQPLALGVHLQLHLAGGEVGPRLIPSRLALGHRASIRFLQREYNANNSVRNFNLPVQGALFGASPAAPKFLARLAGSGCSGARGWAGRGRRPAPEQAFEPGHRVCQPCLCTDPLVEQEVGPFRKHLLRTDGRHVFVIKPQPPARTPAFGGGGNFRAQGDPGSLRPQGRARAQAPSSPCHPWHAHAPHLPLECSTSAV